MKNELNESDSSLYFQIDSNEMLQFFLGKKREKERRTTKWNLNLKLYSKEFKREREGEEQNDNKSKERTNSFILCLFNK